MATYAIGDIQGCFNEFMRLLERVEFSRDDKLWLTGDLVNRGPQSLEVLRWAVDHDAQLVSVLGNHDLHLLEVWAGVGKLQKRDTLTPILEAGDRDDLLLWLRTRPFVYREAPYLMVHAGLLPTWSPEEAAALGRELSAIMCGPAYSAFLGNRRGPAPDQWSDRLSGIERQRVMVNAFTRLRFCNAAGRMEFEHNGPAASAPAGYYPWFNVPGRQSSQATIVFGHWAALGFHAQPGIWALDSGCVWGNALTAVRLDDGRIFQLPCGTKR